MTYKIGDGKTFLWDVESFEDAMNNLARSHHEMAHCCLTPIEKLVEDFLDATKDIRLYDELPDQL